MVIYKIFYKELKKFSFKICNDLRKKLLITKTIISKIIQHLILVYKNKLIVDLEKHHHQT